MNLDGTFKPAVMGIFHVRIAATDMGNDYRVFTLQDEEQCVGRVDGISRGLALDQNMRRAADRAAFVAVKNIPVTTHACVARPLVSRQANKPSRFVKLGRQAVELVPEIVGNLEVVALVADHIDKGRVARVAEIGFGRAHPDRFTALSVEIAPIAAQCALP